MQAKPHEADQTWNYAQCPSQSLACTETQDVQKHKTLTPLVATCLQPISGNLLKSNFCNAVTPHARMVARSAALLKVRPARHTHTHTPSQHIAFTSTHTSHQPCLGRKTHKTQATVISCSTLPPQPPCNLHGAVPARVSPARQAGLAWRTCQTGFVVVPRRGAAAETGLSMTRA